MFRAPPAATTQRTQLCLCFIRGSTLFSNTFCTTISAEKQQQLIHAHASQRHHRSCHSPTNVNITHMLHAWLLLPPSGMYMYLHTTLHIFNVIRGQKCTE